MTPGGANAAPGNGWRGRPEGGSRFGLRIVALAARWLGRPSMRLLLYPVTLYFFAFRRVEREASRAYLERVLGRPPAWREVFEHFMTFARVTADRVYFVSGQAHRLPVTVHRIPEMQALVDRGKGGIALAAHMGSFEAARVLGAQVGGVDLRVVLDLQIARKLISELEELDRSIAASIIDANQPAAALGLQIAAALERADWVGFLADRHRPGDRTTRCEFLGGTIRLPVGPFLIAATFGVPLVCIFPLYVEGRYEIYCEILSSAFSLERGNREAALQEYAQTFADRMSDYLRLAPYNWFNFYDYWADDA